jgi:hypothetical protein
MILKHVADDGSNKGLKHVGLIHIDCIVNTKTYNKSASVGQVLCVTILNCKRHNRYLHENPCQA